MDAYSQKINNAFLFYFFTLKKLPSLWFWGIKVASFNGKRCCIRISYSWFTKNPFQSIYFSALSGAAELSTGLIVQQHALANGNTSMLVIKSQAEFLKKAKGTIVFCCDEGEMTAKTFSSLQQSGSSAELVLNSQGIDEQGQVVARFTFTWALKKR